MLRSSFGRQAYRPILPGCRLLIHSMPRRSRDVLFMNSAAPSLILSRRFMGAKVPLDACKASERTATGQRYGGFQPKPFPSKPAMLRSAWRERLLTRFADTQSQPTQAHLICYRSCTPQIRPTSMAICLIPLSGLLRRANTSGDD